ncbi:MAG: transport permease protein [Nitrospira sp.]
MDFYHPGTSVSTVRRIRPTSGMAPLNLMDLWKQRELLYFMMRRDLTVRYRQMALGAIWAIIQPLLTMVVFTVLFGWLAKVPSSGTPYPLFAYVALLPWQLFASTANSSSASLVANQHLLSKVAFPRIVLPVSSIAASLSDFLIASLCLLGMLIYYETVPTGAVVILPILVLITLAAGLGIGLWVSALSVRHRDLRYALPFCIQIGMFVTPVVYSTNLVPEQWRLLYALNPMAGVVEGFRWALTGDQAVSPPMLCLSVVLTGALFFSGLAVFRQRERTLADMV